MKQLPELHLGTINLPPDTITKCINILAKRGAGKSYLAGVLEEELAKNDYPFVIIDPMGAHWGLRELYPIPIFGGDHGDVDIEVQDGPRLANLIVDLKKSILIDVSHWDQDTQREFVTEFVNELYQKNRKPLHVIIEETDVFAPQTGGGKEGKASFKAIENLVRRGRGRGIGVTSITQRASILHKNILSQADLNIILNMQANRDLESVKELLDDDGIDSKGRKEIMNKIKRFGKGQAMFYSPQWLKLTEPHHIRRRETHHAGSEPPLDGKVPKVKLKRLKKDKYIDYLNRDIKNADLEKEKQNFKTETVFVILGLFGAALLIGTFGFL